MKLFSCQNNCVMTGGYRLQASWVMVGGGAAGHSQAPASPCCCLTPAVKVKWVIARRLGTSPYNTFIPSLPLSTIHQCIFSNQPWNFFYIKTIFKFTPYTSYKTSTQCSEIIEEISIVHFCRCLMEL